MFKGLAPAVKLLGVAYRTGARIGQGAFWSSEATDFLRVSWKAASEDDIGTGVVKLGRAVVENGPMLVSAALKSASTLGNVMAVTGALCALGTIFPFLTVATALVGSSAIPVFVGMVAFAKMRRKVIRLRSAGGTPPTDPPDGETSLGARTDQVSQEAQNEYNSNPDNIITNNTRGVTMSTQKLKEAIEEMAVSCKGLGESVELLKTQISVLETTASETLEGSSQGVKSTVEGSISDAAKSSQTAIDSLEDARSALQAYADGL